MRVLMLAMSLDLSGQTVHIRHLARGLIDRGHAVAVAAGELAVGRPLGRGYFDEAGIPVFQVGVAHFGGSLAAFARQLGPATQSLGRVLGEFRPDVLHAHAVTMAVQCHAAIALARPRPRPALVTTFNNERIDGRKRLAGRLACRVSPHALGDRVLAISTKMATLMSDEIGIDPRVLRQISYSVDDRRLMPPTPQQRTEARRAAGVEADEIVVVCVARLEPRKRQDVLINAVAALRRREIPITLLLAGDDIGGHRLVLQRLAQREGCAEVVRFLGFQPDILPTLWASDVNALVSSEEGFGLAVVEAGMAGLASVRSRSAGAEDQIVDGVTGLLINPDDLTSVTDAIGRLAADLALRLGLGRAAEHLCRDRYSLARMAIQVEEIYQEVLS